VLFCGCLHFSRQKKQRKLRAVFYAINGLNLKINNRGTFAVSMIIDLYISNIRSSQF
jgi:hypothetical protein